MRKSAGLLVYRDRGGVLEVLLVHPGGPYWAKQDDGAWSIPKGELEGSEDPLAAARREFEEETGTVPDGEFSPLEPAPQPGGKVVHAWAVRGDFDPATLRSGTFTMEWPPRSGRQRAFPEVDRAAWFSMGEARRKILRGQTPLLSQLEEKLSQGQAALTRGIPPLVEP
jgi:predicted NUDIX family NTP pyrophosphohydrolase